MTDGVSDGATEAGAADSVTGAEARRPIRRALVSVYDKTGLPELGRGLADAGVEVVSTGSSAAVLSDAGVPVTPVADLTGFPECLDGRVKTLHPGIHAGLLADPRRADHVRSLEELGIAPFQLVVCNLYPFGEAAAAGADPDRCVELIDIGGPAMVRAAAKNHAGVAVVTDPGRYPDVLDAARSGGFTAARRAELAALAFQHTASYDVSVATHLTSTLAPDAASGGLPNWLGGAWRRTETLRYGENPHQPAAIYTGDSGVGATGGPARAELLHGKAMSYNNHVDADAAWRAAHDFDAPCAAIIKHTNPCGIALGRDIAEAHRKAHACDPGSAFGGVIAVNRAVSPAMARQAAEVFTEVVVAPGYEGDALDVLTAKKSVRLLRCPPPARGTRVELRQVGGGMLAQHADLGDAAGDVVASWDHRAGPPADDPAAADLAFAWRAVRAVKSNAILLASDGATAGVGMGQVNRVDAARLAVTRAGSAAAGAVAASDAFFPFPDGLEVLADAGVRAVVEPGGSVRDAEVIAAADKLGVGLYFTGTRHFLH